MYGLLTSTVLAKDYAHCYAAFRVVLFPQK